MKKIFLFIAVFLMFSAVASAQRVDVKATDSHYTITLLKAKVLKEDLSNAENKVELFYDTDDKTLYISVHGLPGGKLYLQKKGKYAGETVEQCVNRLLKENGYLFKEYQINKVVLIACYESSRHRDNPKSLYIGHSDFLNADIEEISWFDGIVSFANHTKNGIVKAVIYDMRMVFNGENKNNDAKLAKQATKEHNADWAIPVIDDTVKKKLKIIN